MDRIDQRILAELMGDATLPLARLADRVGLSMTPCWKRVQKLEASGVITGRVALVDPAKVGLPLMVLIEVEALDHTSAWQSAFLSAVDREPAVIEVLRLGGSADYLLRAQVADMSAYDALYRRLTAAVAMRSVSSKFVMERLRHRTVLPIAEPVVVLQPKSKAG
jgi:Lrp/AsnC family transcriptional regulator